MLGVHYSLHGSNRHTFLAQGQRFSLLKALRHSRIKGANNEYELDGMRSRMRDGSANQTPGTGAGTTTVASPFLATWKYYPDRYCTDNWLYSDVNCTQLEGTVTLTGSLPWAATTVSGWTNPVRVETKYMNYKVTGNVVVDEAEAKDEFSASKTILGISDKQLFAGDLSIVAAVGYPTAFRTKPLAYR